MKALILIIFLIFAQIHVAKADICEILLGEGFQALGEIHDPFEDPFNDNTTVIGGNRSTPTRPQYDRSRVPAPTTQVIIPTRKERTPQEEYEDYINNGGGPN